MSERIKFLLTVKAYPQPSRSYSELVCTAGIREDGSWIRIYPVPLRSLDLDKFSKYSWIEMKLKQHEDDFRPESYRPINIDLSDMECIDEIGTENYWAERKKYCLQNVYTNMNQLIEDSQEPENKSLATFKPSRITGFEIEEVERDWKEKWERQWSQKDLFFSNQEEEKAREKINKLPYKFKYTFEDDEGYEATMMIEDWEIGALYWNCLRRAEGDEEEALNKVRMMYRDTFTSEKDLYLFLGTTKEWHQRRAPNPFVIIGVFYPKKDPEKHQQELF